MHRVALFCSPAFARQIRDQQVASWSCTGRRLRARSECSNRRRREQWLERCVGSLISAALLLCQPSQVWFPPRLFQHDFTAATRQVLRVAPLSLLRLLRVCAGGWVRASARSAKNTLLCHRVCWLRLRDPCWQIQHVAVLHGPAWLRHALPHSQGSSPIPLRRVCVAVAVLVFACAPFSPPPTFVGRFLCCVMKRGCFRAL
jgi:hypothetical protein